MFGLKKNNCIIELLALDILSNWIDLTRILFWFNRVRERGSGHGKFQFYQNISAFDLEVTFPTGFSILPKARKTNSLNI